MAFDGITTACLRKELEEKLLGSRIMKIAQIGTNEIVLTLHPVAERGGGQAKLLLSADPSLPLCYITTENKNAPATAPAFCMLLRKHLSGGRIVAVEQPGLDRILRFTVEHPDEMGDLERHTLVMELMGKYSNLIFTDESDTIVDSIRRVSSMMSSVREVLPGRPWFIPETQGRRNALAETKENFAASLSGSTRPPASVLTGTYTGFSNITGEELVRRAGIADDLSAGTLTEQETEKLWQTFSAFTEDVRSGKFTPTVYFSAKTGAEDGTADTRLQPCDFAAFGMEIYGDRPSRVFSDMSSLLEFYYAEKNRDSQIRQRTSDLRHIVQSLLERDVHKYDLQRKQLKDTEKKDKYRLFGELLNAYGYEIEPGTSSCELEDWHTGQKVKITLDPQASPAENAKKFFARYTKLKRTEEALSGQTEATRAEIAQLESILVALGNSAEEGDLAQIREELEKGGLLRRHGESTKGKAGRTKVPVSRPFHYVSSDGFDIYVGKNNLQNDELTFHTAGGSDLWFHANDMPGSHVILKTGGRAMEEIPDSTFREAAALAAYYSSGRNQEKVEIDYVQRREVKKPAGAAPGFVIYHTNYSMMGDTDISGIRKAGV